MPGGAQSAFLIFSTGPETTLGVMPIPPDPGTTDWGVCLSTWNIEGKWGLNIKFCHCQTSDLILMVYVQHFCDIAWLDPDG